MDNVIEKPRVCICVPVKNGAKTIRTTLKSIIAQDYKNINIVICDNNSTDDTKLVVESFAKDTNSKIDYIFNANEGSGEQNWNYLLKHIPKGYDFYSFYHADDVYSKTMVSEQVQLIQSTGVGAVFCAAKLINESGEEISISKLPKEITEKVFSYQALFNYTLKYYNFVKAPSFFFDKKILEDGFSFDPRFKSSADLDMWLKIAEKYKIAIINKPLLLYRISNNQITYLLSKGKETEADYFTVMDFHIQKNKVDKKMLNWYECYRGMNMITRAVNLCKHDKNKEALVLLKRAVSFKRIPYLMHISRGMRNFLLGFALKNAIHFKLDKKLITLIKR